MNRTDLQKLTKTRLKETKTLLNAQQYNGAFYLSGYIVECALKSCIAKNTKKYDFPDKKAINKIYTHVLIDLVNSAGLQNDLNQEINSNPQFEVNWALVKDWNENSRYEEHTDKEAKNIYSAITNRKNGVLNWIKRHW